MTYGIKIIKYILWETKKSFLNRQNTALYSVLPHRRAKKTFRPPPFPMHSDFYDNAGNPETHYLRISIKEMRKSENWRKGKIAPDLALYNGIREVDHTHMHTLGLILMYPGVHTHITYHLRGPAPGSSNLPSDGDNRKSRRSRYGGVSPRKIDGDGIRKYVESFESYYYGCTGRNKDI